MGKNGCLVCACTGNGQGLNWEIRRFDWDLFCKERTYYYNRTRAFTNEIADESDEHNVLSFKNMKFCPVGIFGE